MARKATQKRAINRARSIVKNYARFQRKAANAEASSGFVNKARRAKKLVKLLRAKRTLKGRSVQLGPSLAIKGSTTVHKATDGYIVAPHYQSIGSRRKVNKIVQMMYPSHRLVYRTSGITSYVDNEQAVTLIKTNETIDLNDALTAIKGLVYDVQGPSLPGNANLETSGTTEADPANVRIGGYINKMYLETHYTKLTLTSNVELGQKIEVLPILVRNNTPSKSLDSTNDSTVRDPLMYWKQLVLQQQVSTIANVNPTQAQAATINRLGARPYDKEYKRDFERWFKCLTPARFVLQSGQQTTYGMMQNIYKELQMSELFDCIGVEGITMYYMVFTESTLVGNGNSVGIQVNTGSTNCMYMLEQTRTVRMTSFMKGHTLTCTNTLSQIARNDQVFIEPQGGEVEIGTAIAEV